MEGIERIITDRVIFNDMLNKKDKWNINGSYLILSPSYAKIEPFFFLALANAVNVFNELGIKHKIVTEINTYLPDAREGLSKRSFLEDYTHLIWLDTDVVFASSELLYLMEAIELTKDYDMVSPVIKARLEPHMPLVYKDNAIAQIPKFQEWMQADAVGFGCLLMPKKVLETIERPHFQTEYKENGRLTGEDIFFFRKAKKAGLRLGVNLFSRFGHIGAIAWWHDA